MKYWFNGFLEEIIDGLNKMLVEKKRQKNPEYKDTGAIKKKIKLGFRIFFVVILICIVIGFSIQAKETI